MSAPFIGYAAAVEPALLKVREETIIIDNLPAGFDGYRIAQLTDFHYRPILDEALISKAVAEAMGFEPDLIALTGDFIDESNDVLEPLLEVLSPLAAPHGVYGVIGNHDYYYLSNEGIREAFQKSSIQLLLNEVCESTLATGEKLQIVGLDTAYNNPNFSMPVKGRGDAFRLVLAHEPDVFDKVVKNYAPHLQLSGHTHGGQVRVPFIGYAPFTPSYGHNYVDGHFQVEDSRLFVSSGLGTSIARLRLACKPEVVFLTLKKAT